MKKRKILLLLGSVLLAMVLVMLPLMSACGPAEEEVVEEEEEEGPAVEEGEKELEEIRVLTATQSSSKQWGEVDFAELMKVWDEACSPLGYKIVHEAHYGGELFPGEQAIEALAMGSMQFGPASGYSCEGFEPRFAIGQIPLLWKDLAHAIRFYHTPEFQKVVADLEKRGVKIIMPTTHAYELWPIFKNVKVTCIEDMADMRFRCMQSPTMVRAIELIGANPIAVAAPELTVAMQTGMLDGLLAGLGPAFAWQLGYFDYMKYGIEFPFSYASGNRAVNTDWWYGLPDEVREALEEMLPDWLEMERRKDTEQFEIGHAQFRENLGIIILTEDEEAKFFDAVEPLYDEMAAEIGRDLVDAALRTREGS